MKRFLMVVAICALIIGVGSSAYATRDMAGNASTDNPVNCFTCHGEGLSAGPVPAPPDHTALTQSCTGCHNPIPEKSEPFPDGTPSNHYGQDLVASCGACHGTFPPTDDGMPAQNHSAFNSDQCGMCHNSWGWVLTPPDADDDGFSPPEDCNDNDASIHPDAVEIPGDNIDQDCDGIDPQIPLKDDDNDGYPLEDEDGNVVDCNDNDASIHPGAEEIPYDKIDNDCEGGDLNDVDGDGHPYLDDEGNVVDCNDNDANIHPGAEEILDNDTDENCDGIAEQTPEEPLRDDDEDGYPYEDENGNVVDCNDNDPSIHPGAEEIPYDKKDNDCEGGDLVDVDGDGYPYLDDEGNVVDCNDKDENINPGAEEILDNEVDENCDGVAEQTPEEPIKDKDEDGYPYEDENGNVVDCNDEDPGINPGAEEIPYDKKDNDCKDGDLVDVDGDSYPYQDDDGKVVDCDDENANINPGADEICGDTKDNDCDWLVDDADVGDCPIEGEEEDKDGDGYIDDDCNDNDPSIHPGAKEICDDGKDNDCDDLVDAADVDDCTEEPPPEPGCGEFDPGNIPTIPGCGESDPDNCPWRNPNTDGA